VVRLRLVVPVPESAVPDLHLGQAIDVVVPALGARSREKSLVLPMRSAMRPAPCIPRSTWKPDDTLVEGMYAETKLILHQKDNALTIPVQAVKRDGSSASVFVVDKSGNVAERPITLGVDSDARIEILTGLTDGDQVVVGNVNAITSRAARPRQTGCSK